MPPVAGGAGQGSLPTRWDPCTCGRSGDARDSISERFQRSGNSLEAVSKGVQVAYAALRAAMACPCFRQSGSVPKVEGFRRSRARMAARTITVHRRIDLMGLQERPDGIRLDRNE